MSDILTDEARQRAEWRGRLAEALLRRDHDDEILMEMLSEGLHKAHQEGIEDAAVVCEEIARVLPSGDVGEAFGVAARSLRKLAEQNRRDHEEVRAAIPLVPPALPT